MMTGIVTAQRDAILRLTLRDANGQDQVCDSVVDTGYSGTLTRPPHIIAALGFNWRRYGDATLADGSLCTFNIYEGVVLWDGQPVTIRMDELDGDSLVGMSLMYGYELVLPILDGATFTLRKITIP